MKRTFIVILLISILINTGCLNRRDNVLYTTISQIDLDANGHIKQLADYNSPYTICYENKDTTYSMYIFTSPIQYKTEVGEYAIIDNRIVRTEKPGFYYENKANNIKTYFPKKLFDPFRVEKNTTFLEFVLNWDVNGFSDAKQLDYTNMYGDKVNAVVYARKDMDLVFYPTKAGIKSEIVLKTKTVSNEFSFTIKSSAVSYENKQNGYILFKNGSENESIIYQPLVQYMTNKGQQLDVTAQMNISREEENDHVTIAINEGILRNVETKHPIKLDLSFDMYLNKMPDSTVYSKHDINNYLASYAIVGEHSVYGEGWHYLRFRLQWFIFLDSNKISSATYYSYSLYGSVKNTKIGIFNMDENWTSSQIIWSTRKKQSTKYCENAMRQNGYNEFDISQYIKKSFEDKYGIEETCGLMFKSETENTYAFLATSDNALYSPFLKINLKVLPTAFIPRENINPPT